MAGIFELTEDQSAKLKKWQEENPSGYCGAIGGSTTYCFTPTSIGMAIVVKKMVKGKEVEIDLTDYDSW